MGTGGQVSEPRSLGCSGNAACASALLARCSGSAGSLWAPRPCFGSFVRSSGLFCLFFCLFDTLVRSLSLVCSNSGLFYVLFVCYFGSFFAF